MELETEDTRTPLTRATGRIRITALHSSTTRRLRRSVSLGAARGETALIHAVGGTDMWQRGGDCPSSEEVGLTFEVPGAGRRPEHPGVLHEFRVIE